VEADKTPTADASIIKKLLFWGNGRGNNGFGTAVPSGGLNGEGRKKVQSIASTRKNGKHAKRATAIPDRENEKKSYNAMPSKTREVRKKQEI